MIVLAALAFLVSLSFTVTALADDHLGQILAAPVAVIACSLIAAQIYVLRRHL
jgi:hypothetical protein